MNRQSARGFTMIEILIALFIFAVGVLGAGALQLSSLNANKNNLYRTQAMILAEEVIDQMRANPNAAKAGISFDNFDTSTSVSKPGCVANATGCSGSDIANLALFNWKESLKTLPNGKGTVTRGLANSFTVEVSWDETNTATRLSGQSSSYSVIVTL